MDHVKEFLRCASYRYRDENIQFLFLFDWSSGHAAMAEDALVSSKMGWYFGGKQPKMHPTKMMDQYPNANDPSLRYKEGFNTWYFS